MGCEQYQDLMVEALYGELSDEDRRVFDAHVGECDECASALSGMRGTLDLMKKRERRDPGDAYWDAYWDRLDARMKAEGVTSTNVVWWRRPVPVRAWTYRAAAAAAILVIGVFVGRNFFPATQPPVATERDRVAATEPGLVPEDRSATQETALPESTPTATDVATRDDATEPVTQSPGATTSQPAVSRTGGSAQAASADDRAMRYIEKSQLLLIALVNGDPADEPDGYAAGFSEQQRRSRELVGEGDAVKAGLDNAGERRLRELVSELQKILIQIANLESDEDVDAVEFIRSRVNDRDVLFKINLEQMRHEDEGNAGENLKRSL